MDWSDGILGHDVPKKFFSNFLADPGRMPHALLLSGPPGVGKFALAYAFARAFNCIGDGNPQCECRHCRQLGLGTFPDVLISSSLGEIKADRMRQLVNEVVISPRASRARLVIIDDFERVNEVSANIFLKTLEEPPGHLRFILITARPDRLLSTILSRCIPIEFRPSAPDDTADFLKALFTEHNVAAIERFSRSGRPGKAVRDIYARIQGARDKKNDRETYGEMMDAFLEALLLITKDEFAFHLKPMLKTMLDSVESDWKLREKIPKGLDAFSLKQFINGDESGFSPVNYLTENGRDSDKLREYEKALIFIEDLLSLLYSHYASLDASDEINRLKLLRLLERARVIRKDLNTNRNIELSFETLLMPGASVN